MSDDYKGYIDDIRSNMEMMKLNNMRENCKVSKEEKCFLMDVITFKKFQKKPKSSDDQPQEKKIVTMSKTDDLIDKYVYQRPWGKLKYEQKRIKLLEYIESNLISSDKSNIEHVKTNLLKDLKDDKLKTSKLVNYDQLKRNIISIKGLSYNKSKKLYIYEIKKTTQKKKPNYFYSNR